MHVRVPRLLLAAIFAAATLVSTSVPAAYAGSNGTGDPLVMVQSAD